MKGKVGIITRTKNRTILLERAILSVLNQTYQNWEMIIVNDGGDAAPVDRLVQKYHDQFGNRVKIIHNPESRGMEAASNIGVQNTSSEFIVIHDDDDSWDACFLEKTVGFMDSSEGQLYKGVATKVIQVIEEIADNEVKVMKKELWRPEILTIQLAEMANRNQLVPISFLYKKEVHDEIGYYDESLPVLGDWEFYLRFLLRHDIFLLNEYLANYHHRIQQKSEQYSNSASSLDKFNTVRTRIKNKHLREDIQSGRFGLGWLLNSKTEYDLNDFVIQSSVKFIVKQLLYNRITSVILYGSGGYAHRLYKELAASGIKVTKIADGNSSIWGSCIFDNIQVDSVDHILEQGELQPFVVGSYSYAEEIVSVIRRACEKRKIEPIIFAP